MLRWLGPRKGSPDRQAEEVTEDPLAAIGPKRKGDKIYSVSRVNPIFDDGCPSTAVKVKTVPTRNSYPPSAEKSDSSGYCGSRVGPSDERLRLRDDLVVEQNSAYVKSIQVAPLCVKSKSIPSLGSGSSTRGTLTTIPEGKVDLGVPKPIWPNGLKHISQYDSLVDEALLLYTSTSYVPNDQVSLEKDVSLREVLVDLSNCISATIEGKSDVAPEVMLKAVKEKITASLGLLRNSTEEDMRKLCINLSKLQQVNSVVRAFTNSSSSGNSSQGSPELNSARERRISDEADEIYQVPSGSSSSGFSDSVKHYPVAKFTLPQDDAALQSQGIRNAIIYGTLCRTNVKVSSANDKLCAPNGNGAERKRSLLQSNPDSKPSVWQQYYGVNIAQGSSSKHNPKPSDVPLYPGGRPEADFTLDVPRSELLAKRMKQDKKWRLRCRLITSFLGLVFFLLSVMAVSLMLTRGKRMFGSMM
uniref:Uncharacterized protein n=1 Tax=Photinus pyralis TaxID=7054 RepID=A0A1Y1KIT8_PHOPY